MKIKVDENLPTEVAEHLRSMGESADTVVEEGLGGFADPAVVAAATAEGRTLLTLDKGLGDLRLRKEGDSLIVLVRPPKYGRGAVLGFLLPILPSLLLRMRTGGFRVLVVTERGIRSR